jgi:hypothetical protein
MFVTGSRATCGRSFGSIAAAFRVGGGPLAGTGATEERSEAAESEIDREGAPRPLKGYFSAASMNPRGQTRYMETVVMLPLTPSGKNPPEVAPLLLLW